jgi:hypothetical protein
MGRLGASAVASDESADNEPVHFLASRRLLIESCAGGADETADKNGGAVIIVVVAFDDLSVHRDAGLVGKAAFNAGGVNGGRREPVGVAVGQAADHIAWAGGVVEVLHLHFVDHRVGKIPGALVDAVGGDGRVRAGLPSEPEIGRIHRSRKRHTPQGGKKNQTGLGLREDVLIKPTERFHH